MRLFQTLLILCNLQGWGEVPAADAAVSQAAFKDRHAEDLHAAGAEPLHRSSVRVTLTEPAYAKWGRVAMQETAKRYDADIVDYLHVGYRTVSPGIGEETFKLWLRSTVKEFGVYVIIRFETESNRVISIDFSETDR